ncbi:hypothetical protein I4U23_010745 [Adineta vaga]|nr:hypothetical protein I4U23_010745 [Adineta vaga]
MDLDLHELELEWRKSEIQSMRTKVEYLRYLSRKVDELLLLICTEWNVKGIGWFVDIENWFFSHRAVEREIQERLSVARKAAA